MVFSFVLKGCRVLTPLEDLGVGDILVKGGLIAAVGRGLIGDRVIDCRGLTAAPGIIDTHVHGYGGLDFTGTDAEAIMEAAALLPETGVTSFLPTPIAAPHETLLATCEAVRRAAEKWTPRAGARPLGLHLEGPYVNPELRGALPLEHLRKPSLAEFEEYLQASSGLIVQVTVAPELDGALEFIEKAAAAGVVVSIGHTRASYELTMKAVDLGARKATHIFNRMEVFHHRAPGAAIALLERKEVFVEMILDNVHLHPATSRLVYRLAGPERVVLISDATQASGLSNGEYVMGGVKIVVRGGVSKLVGEDTLAGSVLAMDMALRNAVQLGVPLREAAMMASYTPAKSVGALSRYRVGLIEPGFKADIVLLDEELRVSKTFVEGELVHER